VEKKKCSKCRRTKEVKLFSRNASMPDGYHHYCNSCNRKRMAKYFSSPAGKAAVKRATLKRKKARRQAARKSKSTKTRSK